jgi:hypothetical protein
LRVSILPESQRQRENKHGRKFALNGGKKRVRTSLSEGLCFSCLTVLLLWVIPGMAQTQPGSGIAALTPQPGKIRATVVDKDGAVVGNVKVTLAQDGVPATSDTLSDGDGNFAFANVAAGPFQLTLSSTGFATQTKSGVLHAGEDYVIPQIVLAIGETTTDVEVKLTPVEVAEGQIRDQEKQRLFGVLPNFYVSYDPHPVPLNSRQKFQLAWKTSIDPVSFGITGIIAAFEQANDTFAGYGQGAQGYAKRYGAAYADFVSGTFIGGAILPSLLKQDPRYFYKGTGSRKSRFLYAMANAVICKGDNGRWQPNYSSIIGDMASAAISNFYYPPADRFSGGLTFENAGIGIGANAFGNVVQEFLLRKLTPHARDQERAKP